MTAHLAYYGDEPDTAPCGCDGCRAERLEKVLGGILEGFAEYLTSMDDYPFPENVIAPLGDLGVDAQTREFWFAELLRTVVRRHATPNDPEVSPWWIGQVRNMLMGLQR
jgi:hypothetical protein